VKTSLSILLAGLSIFSLSNFSFASLPADHAVLECPKGSVVAQKLADDSEVLFSVIRAQGITYHIGMNINYLYLGDKNAAEVFLGTFVSTPIKVDPRIGAPKLMITLAEKPTVVAFNGDGGSAYISCRYQISNASPAYLSSDSQGDLVHRGLTSITDGYFNLEANIKRANCELRSNDAISCDAIK
jgi:hypothetical protein